MTQIDMTQIEAQARQMRAEATRNALRRLTRAIAGLFRSTARTQNA